MSSKDNGWLEGTVGGAIDNRVLILALTILFSALGSYFLTNMSVDAVPDISNVQVVVTANGRGLAPQEVEQYVTYPIELAMQSLPRLLFERSISKYNLGQVTTVFEDGTDIYWARQQVAERLKAAQEQIPANMNVKISLGPIATGLGEIFQFEVRGSGYSLMQLRDILDWEIIPALKTVPGVDDVESMGGDVREYQVRLLPEKLHGYRVMPGEVMKALEQNNGNAGGGYAIEHNDQIILRAEGLLTDTEDIGNVIIRRTPQGTIRVKDLSDVTIGKMLEQSIVTHDGEGETTIGIVLLRKGENSKLVVERVKEKINQIRNSLPPNVEIKTYYDRSVLIGRTIDTVKDNLLHGAMLVVVVLFLLLGDLRGGLISAIAIPLSLLGAVSFLSLAKISGNLFSLGAIDFGILIDGSVVMVEHILSRLADAKGSGESKLTVVSNAAREVAAPVLFAVLIITVVYLPILALPGVSGKTFQPMALTVVFGLLTALAIALYLTPSLSYFVLSRHPKKEGSLLMRLIRPCYKRALLSCVRHPYLTSSIALITFITSLSCISIMGSEFVPTLKEGSIVLTVYRPLSGSLDTAAQQTTQIEKLIQRFPEVDRVVSRTGHSEQAFDPMGSDETDIFVILKPVSQWPAQELQQKIEDRISKTIRKSIPGVVFISSQPIEQRMNELIAGSKGDVAIRVFGPDLDKLHQLGLEIARIIAKVEGGSDLKVEQTEGLPTVTAHLNSKALSGYGVNAQDALDTVEASVAGKVVGTIFKGKPRYSLVVRFAPSAMQSPEDLGDLPVAMMGGDLVPLKQIATVKRSEGAAQIAHLQGNRYLTVQVNVRGRDLGGYVHAIQKTVDQNVVLPSGYHIEWGGQFENLQEAQCRLFFLVPVALMLIFILLYALFSDVLPGLLIFTNIPLALSGGIFALLARQMPLSVTAGVGFIALFGVAVLNGVVLVSTIRGLEREQKLPPRQASLLGAMQRLRPVLMTATVASLGFLPMALATSVGAEVQRPLATVVIGGLISSTLLTLLVLPSLYPLICGKSAKNSVALSDKQLAQA